MDGFDIFQEFEEDDTTWADLISEYHTAEGESTSPISTGEMVVRRKEEITIPPQVAYLINNGRRLKALENDLADLYQIEQRTDNLENEVVDINNKMEELTSEVEDLQSQVNQINEEIPDEGLVDLNPIWTMTTAGIGIVSLLYGVEFLLAGSLAVIPSAILLGLSIWTYHRLRR